MLPVPQLLEPFSLQLSHPHIEQLLIAEPVGRLQYCEHVVGLRPGGHVLVEGLEQGLGLE
jgi:hypothetical protein